jgi:hypothetical protein
MGEAVRGWSARQKNVILGTLFVLEFVLALLPPVHWAVSGRSPEVAGLPFSLFYFLALGALITASIVAVYLIERARGELD